MTSQQKTAIFTNAHEQEDMRHRWHPHPVAGLRVQWSAQSSQLQRGTKILHHSSLMFQNWLQHKKIPGWKLKFVLLLNCSTNFWISHCFCNVLASGKLKRTTKDSGTKTTNTNGRHTKNLLENVFSDEWCVAVEWNFCANPTLTLGSNTSFPYTAIRASWYACPHLTSQWRIVAACVSRPVTEKDTAPVINPDNSAWLSLARSLVACNKNKNKNLAGRRGTRCACASRKGVFEKLWRRKTLGPEGHEERRWAEVGVEKGFDRRSQHQRVCRRCLHCICVSQSTGSSESWSGGKFALHLLQRRQKRRFRLLRDEARVRALWCPNLVIV